MALKNDDPEKARHAELLVQAAWARSRPDCLELAEYYELKEKGIKKQSLAALSRFCTTAGSWEQSQRRAFVNDYLHQCLSRDDAPRLSQGQQMPHELVVRVILPTLEHWRDDEPKSSVPCRWLAYASTSTKSDPGGHTSRHYSEAWAAIKRDPTDSIARLMLLEFVSTSTYVPLRGLPDFFWGDESNIGWVSELIDKGFELAAGLVEQEDREKWQRNFDQDRELLTSYVDYLASKSSETFSAWALSEGRPCRW